MNHRRALVRLLALLLAAHGGLALRGAESTPAAPPPAEKKAAPSPASAPKAPPAAEDGVQRMEREFGERSKDLIDRRKVLLERLRLAQTEEEKQRLIAELRRQQQERVDQQRELARQIREQMQTQRPARPGS